MLRKLFDILEDGNRKDEKFDEVKREYEDYLGKLMYQ